MARKRLTLLDLLAAGVFDPAITGIVGASTKASRLTIPRPEELRAHAYYFRGRNDAKYGAAAALQKFAEAVEESARR